MNPFTYRQITPGNIKVTVGGFFALKKSSLESKKNIAENVNDALAKLAAYAWPGNVRELANTIDRAVVLGSG